MSGGGFSLMSSIKLLPFTPVVFTLPVLRRSFNWICFKHKKNNFNWKINTLLRIKYFYLKSRWAEMYLIPVQRHCCGSWRMGACGGGGHGTPQGWIWNMDDLSDRYCMFDVVGGWLFCHRSSEWWQLIQLIQDKCGGRWLRFVLLVEDRKVNVIILLPHQYYNGHLFREWEKWGSRILTRMASTGTGAGGSTLIDSGSSPPPISRALMEIDYNTVNNKSIHEFLNERKSF